MSILVVMGVVVGMCGWVLTQRVEKVSGVMGVGGGRDVCRTSAKLCTATSKITHFAIAAGSKSAQNGRPVDDQRGVSLSDVIAKSYLTVVECEIEVMSKSYGKSYGKYRGA